MASERPIINKRKSFSHRSSSKKGRFGRFLLKSFFVLFILTILGGLGAWWGYELVTDPYKKWAQEFNLDLINELEKPSLIYDRNGQEIGRIYIDNRSYVTIDKISPNMVNALVAQEDSRFFVHKGFDPLGIARAAVEMAKNSGEANQGASTLTQQLARNAYDLKERAKARGESGFGRKIVEIFLAMRIEERYDKKQILEFYLNRVYLGSGFYGIRAASLGYFGKEPIDLTTKESASIAALIKNPNNISPLNSEKNNLKWRNHVLDRMAKEGIIKHDEAERIKQLPIGLNPKPLRRGVSHIYDRISSLMAGFVGAERVATGGLKIYTTLDKRMQDQAQASLEKALEEIENRKGYKYQKARDFKADGISKPEFIDGSVLLIDNMSGAVLAYIGGRDFGKRQFDIIEFGKRPAGTALMPFVYAAGFAHKKLSPATALDDDPIDNRMVGVGGSEGILGEWGAEDRHNRYEGKITARNALAKGKIAATVRFGQKVGPEPLVSLMKTLKISPPKSEQATPDSEPFYRPRIYLGFDPVSLKELVHAYSALGNSGSMSKDLYFLDKIEDEDGNVLWTSPQSQGSIHQIPKLDPVTTFQVTSILQDSLNQGSAKRIKKLLDKRFNGVVKTGSTHDFSDNWLLGYNDKVTCGVWIGFLENKKSIYMGAFSSDTCGPVFASTLGAAMNSYAGSAKWKMPPSLEQVEICRVSGKRASRFCYDLDPNAPQGTRRYRRSTYVEFLRKGDTTLDICDVHGDGEISLEMLANSFNEDSTSNRILPIAPIIPSHATLLGPDPYHSEMPVFPKNRTYENPADLPGEMKSPTRAIVVEEDFPENSEEEFLIELPKPSRIEIPLPPIEFQH